MRLRARARALRLISRAALGGQHRRVDLDPTGDGTLVRFSHDGWTSDEGSFPSSALAWARLMDSLKRYVETGTGTLLPGRN